LTEEVSEFGDVSRIHKSALSRCKVFCRELTERKSERERERGEERELEETATTRLEELQRRRRRKRTRRKLLLLLHKLERERESAGTEESRTTVELFFCLYPSDNPNQAPRFFVVVGCKRAFISRQHRSVCCTLLPNAQLLFPFL